MIDAKKTPGMGMKTDERICDCPAKVFWDANVMAAFPTDTARKRVLEPIEGTMRCYGTTTLYYHLEKIDGFYIRYETSEQSGCIYVDITLSEPLVIHGLDDLAFDGCELPNDFDDNLQ